MKNESIFSNFFYIYPKILIPFGIVFSSLNIILFSSKNLSKVPISFMFKLLAINNLINFINFGLWSFDGLDQLNLDSSTVASCKIIALNAFLVIASNNWILVFISLDRLIMILYPIKPKIFRNKYIYVFISFIIYVYNLLFYIPVILHFDLIENSTYCFLPNMKYIQIIFYMNILNSIMLPFGLMFCLSVFIIIALKKSKNKLLDASNLAIKKNNRNLKLSTTILALNLVFLFFWIPYIISCILVDISVRDFSHFFIYIHHSTDFFVYMATNSLTRKEFLRILFLIFNFILKIGKI